MSARQRWADLDARMMSGTVMVVIGLACIWLGGHVFHLLVALICGLMVWELVGMLRPGKRDAQLGLGLLSGSVVFIAIYLPVGFALPLLLAPALIGFGQLDANRTIYIAFSVMILLAGFGMMQVRDDMGFQWLLWLVFVVVVTDVAGYFAGRFFGGPKFWPRVSPKKTWAGTIAGWLGAGVVGFIFTLFTPATLVIVLVSMVTSFASQMGDVAESALKRRMGVKDSSTLIPGHGGLFDRFDALLGAALFMLLIAAVVDLPGLAF